MTESWASRLINSAEQAERFREQHRLGQWDDGWCRSSVSGAALTEDVDVPSMQSLAASGCRVELRIEVERLRVRVLAEESQQFVVEASGEWADAAQDDAAASAAAEAAIRHDLSSLLASLPGITARITVTLLGTDPSHSWVRATGAFVSEFQRAGWFGFAQLLAPKPGVANHVLVLDAGASVVTTEGIVVHGPAVWPSVALWVEPARLTPREGDPRGGVPVPTAVLPVETVGTGLVAVGVILEAVAGALAWLWIADSASVIGSGVTIRLAGSRQIEGQLPECPAGDAAPSVALWSWAASSARPGRRQAVLQAVTLQAEEPKDLYSRAGSILDTAEFLYSLSQSGLVQEALAARRAARDSAVAAGRSAADRARAAARSAVDRVLVVVAAGVGVLLANKGDIIDRPVAFGLLGLAAALIVGAGLLAFHLDLPGAARSVGLFRAELEQHAEVLSSRDVEAIAELPSLVDGSEEVRRARAATTAIVGVAIIALFSLAAAVLAGHDPTQRTPPRSTSTATTARSPTTAVNRAPTDPLPASTVASNP